MILFSFGTPPERDAVPGPHLDGQRGDPEATEGRTWRARRPVSETCNRRMVLEEGLYTTRHWHRICRRYAQKHNSHVIGTNKS